ncbi:TetR family transcriptional regulator [Nocardioides sp. SYSU D00038]|uniref:TetR family transcriptional regulator n=1 Tax=Nocardioides sp. SYSU D00038 TaxID=2812554 RepID=UPI001967D3E9|nr:TetR family transcriptional regulator [Nocardioides sp. SYSU D00038]
MTEQPGRSSGAVGLRERHKRSTRRSLEDAALRLFARDGYDATTVEAIAAEAGVSPRTFFRYFAAKDEVLDMGWQERRTRLTDLVAAAPSGLDDLPAAASALAAMATEFEGERSRVRQRARAVRTSAALRGRTADTITAWESALAGGLAARRGLRAPDLRATVAAATAVAVWRTAFAAWLQAPAGPLAPHVEAAFEAVGIPGG